MLRTYGDGRKQWKDLMDSSLAYRPAAAALSMVCAMCVIGAIDIYVAVIAQTISVWQFLIMRLVLAAPVVLALSALGFGTVRPRRFGAVAVRSSLIATGMFCYFGALAFMPIAMALAGLFTSPIFVLLLTAFVLRQRIVLLEDVPLDADHARALGRIVAQGHDRLFQVGDTLDEADAALVGVYEHEVATMLAAGSHSAETVDLPPEDVERLRRLGYLQ